MKKNSGKDAKQSKGLKGVKKGKSRQEVKKKNWMDGKSGKEIKAE